MKTFVILLLFGCIVEKALAQEQASQKTKELKGTDNKMMIAETGFNFRMASAIHNNKKQERRLVNAFSLGASDIKRINIYLDYLEFHSPSGDYSYPQLLNSQINNFVIGPLQSTK
jgi:hypothetical protein